MVPHVDLFSPVQFVLGKTPEADGDQHHWGLRVARAVLASGSGRNGVREASKMLSLVAWFAIPLGAALGVKSSDGHWTNAVIRTAALFRTNLIFRIWTSGGGLADIANPPQRTSTWNSTDDRLLPASPEEIRLMRLADVSMTVRTALSLALFGISAGKNRQLATRLAIGAQVWGLLGHSASLCNIELPRYWSGKVINPAADPQRQVTVMNARQATWEDKVYNWMKIARHVTGIVLSLLSIIAWTGYINNFVKIKYLCNVGLLIFEVVSEIYHRAIIMPKFRPVRTQPGERTQ